MNSVVLLHDNETWTRPLMTALRSRGLRPRAVHVTDDWSGDRDDTAIDWSQVKVLINRVSPSHVRRGNLSAVANANRLIQLVRERTHDRVVELGTGNAWELELSKYRQFQVGTIVGLPVLPSTPVLGSDIDGLTPGSPLQARLAEDFSGARAPASLLVKPDVGGSGFGLVKTNNPFRGTSAPNNDEVDDLLRKIRSVASGAGANGALIQEFVPGRETAPAVFRYEFLRDKLMYVLRISPDGNKEEQFDNCPADACQVGDRTTSEDDVCQISDGTEDRFEIVAQAEADVPHPELLGAMKQYTRFAQAFVCGIEVLERPDGTPVVIDCNSVNTNYNSAAEIRANVPLESRPVERMATEVLGLVKRAEGVQEAMDSHGPIVQNVLTRMFPTLTLTRAS
jgi:hypothetical protein